MHNAAFAILTLGAVGVTPAVAQEAYLAGRESGRPAGQAPRLPEIVMGAREPDFIAVENQVTTGQELLEYICHENNKDVEHLVGK